MDTNTPCLLVVNPASGSNTQSSTDMICDALTTRGFDVAKVVKFPEDPAPDAAMLDAAGIGLVVIYTGDGSMNAVIQKLFGWGGTVLALPGGTMNLLPLRLHRTTDVDAILDVVAGGGALARRPNCVRCDAGVALAGLLVGPGTAWGKVRESMRALSLTDFAAETIEALRQTATGPAIMPQGRRMARAEGYPLIELNPGEHGMQIEGYFAEAPGEFASQAWATLRRRFRDGPHDTLGLADAVALTSADGSPLPCLIDGEAAECASGSRFVVEPCGVDLLATAHDA